MIQDDVANATEETTLEVDAAHGVLSNDTSANGPLTVVEGLYRTTGGGQVYFFQDGSYDYVSAPGFSGTDSVQYTALDSSNNVAGTATLTINVAATALLPFVSIGTQLGQRQVVSAGFPQVGSGIDTHALNPVALTGGGYVVTVDYLDQANGSVVRVQTYDGNNNLLSTFDPGTRVLNMRTAALSDGNYAVAWDTFDAASRTYSGHAELFNATGASLAGPGTLVAPGGSGFPTTSALAALPGGGFVVLQYVGSQLYAWTSDAAGAVVSQPYAIGPDGAALRSAVLKGGEIAALQNANGQQYEVQRYDTQGNPIGSLIVLPSDGNNVAYPFLTALPNGNFAATWTSLLPGSPRGHVLAREHVQIIDANGNLVGNQVARDFDFGTLFGAPQTTVTQLANGGFVLSWHGIYDNGILNDAVQAYDANGNAVGSLIEIPDVTPFGAVLARVFALPQGGFAVGLSAAVPGDHNLQIYDNNGNHVGDVQMADGGNPNGTDYSNILMTNLSNGNSLILYHDENDTGLSSRDTVQTLNLNDGSSTPSIHSGISFKANTTGTIPVVVSLPDPDGSEIVQWLDVTGVPAGWTLSDPGATAAFDGFEWKVLGGNVMKGGEIDLSLTPPTNFAGTETLTVTAHVVDKGNGSQNQSIPISFNVTVTPPPPPAGTSADLIMSDASNGNYEIYDFGKNAVLAAYQLTNIPAPWQAVGLGNFSGSGTSDMLMRNTNTGGFEIFDVSNNTPNGPFVVGGVGLEWTVSGFGDFSGRPGETDMLMRDSLNGNFELYDFSHNTITSATSPGGASLNWQVLGFGDFSGKANETDMLMRDSNTQALRLYEFSNNQIASVTPLGGIGSEWQFAGAGDFSGNAGETDMLMRNTNTGGFEIYDFQNGTITSTAAVGPVGLEWQVAGFADFSGNPNETDMLMRNVNNGNFELYDFRNNAVVSATSLGNVGIEWQVDGTASYQSAGSAARVADTTHSAAAPVAASDPTTTTSWLAQAIQAPQSGTDNWLTQAMQTSGASSSLAAPLFGPASPVPTSLSGSGPAFDAGSELTAGTAPISTLASPNPLQTHTA